MGTWGEAVFECDAAEDWVEQLVSQGKTAIVLKPLTSVLKMRAGGVLEADLCASALAAAEVIAAAQGHPCRGLPDEIRDWLGERDFAPSPADVKLARDAVTRIATSSELRELWENARAWSTGLKKLVERLDRAPKPRKPTQRPSAPRKAAPGKSADQSNSNDASTVKLSEVRKIVRQRKGGLAIIGGKPDYLGFEGAIVRDLVAIGNCPDLQQLKELDLSGRGISDRGLEAIARLTNLQVLDLDVPCVTDAGIAHLQVLSNLKGLKIRRSQLTDAGLEHLVALKSLKLLTVEKSAVTPAGLNKLARQLGCKVFSDVLK